MKQPKKLAETIHIDDYMDYKREVNKRLDKLEESREAQEETMKELTDGVSTINKAIMGDIQDPTRPGMAENMRTVQSNVAKLVKIHEDEARAELLAKQTAAASAANKPKHKEKNSYIESLPWKTITALVGVMSVMAAIIWKLLSMLGKG